MSRNQQNLLQVHLDQLLGLDSASPILDLACGAGQNGLALSRRGIPVVFADRSGADLDRIEQQLTANGLPGRTWQVDLELPGTAPLGGLQFSAVIVFRYLHRPLFPALREAIEPGGLIVYETFTTENRRFGRPNNPDFLLRPRELKTVFADWQIIHYFEGDLQEPDRSVAQLVARKPVICNHSLDNDKHRD
jgi:SAM-dependent methyltransferase